MNDSVVRGIFDVIQTLLWVGFLIFLFLLLRKPLVDGLLPRLTKVNAYGLDFSFAKADELLELASFSNPAESKSPDSQKRGKRVAAISRVEHAAECLKGGRILWVDDHPEGNRNYSGG